MMTQTKLKELLNYNPDTGEFTWRLRRSRTPADHLAGTVNHHGYVSIMIDRQRYQAHRLAWLYVYGVLPPGPLDHINRVRSDNRIQNLRSASTVENLRNRTVSHNTASGYKGVTVSSGRWMARIGVSGVCKYLGWFNTAQDAAQAYNAAARSYFGDFAHLNTIEEIKECE